MEQNISDAEVSSCFEMEEKRKAAEREAVESLELHMNDIIRIAMREDDKIVGEKNQLALKLQDEIRSINTLNSVLPTVQQESRDKLLEMLDLQAQLSNISMDCVNQLTTIQELRDHNYATLRADPIYNLIQEERSLQTKLEEMGIYVYPPTGSDQPC